MLWLHLIIFHHFDQFISKEIFLQSSTEAENLFFRSHKNLIETTKLSFNVLYYLIPHQILGNRDWIFTYLEIRFAADFWLWWECMGICGHKFRKLESRSFRKSTEILTFKDFWHNQFLFLTDEIFWFSDPRNWFDCSYIILFSNKTFVLF